MSRAGSDDSGAVVYPPLPVPNASKRDSDARIRKSSGNISGGSRKHLIGAAVIAVAGIAVGFVARPRIAPDPRIDDLQAQLDTQTKATASSRAHADDLQSDLDKAALTRAAVEARVRDAEAAKTELANRAAAAELAARDAAAVEDKLRATIDKAQGTLSTERDEVHLQLVDKLLFKPNDDQLTDKGRAILDKVAVALRDLADRQIAVEGHTDDSAMPIPPAPPAPKKPSKGAAPAPVPPAPRFQTSWELSAARALQVVHYLQDVAKIEPSRLAALAFGQYRPVSRTNKALNRRIEIVLSPKRAAPLK